MRCDSGISSTTAGNQYVALVMPRVQWFADLFASQDDGSGSVPDATGSTSGSTLVETLAAVASAYGLYKLVRGML